MSGQHAALCQLRWQRQDAGKDYLSPESLGTPACHSIPRFQILCWALQGIGYIGDASVCDSISAPDNMYEALTDLLTCV